MTSSMSMKDIQNLYKNGTNILHLLRQGSHTSTNSTAAVMIAYDLQAGSYVANMDDPAFREAKTQYAAALAGILDGLDATSILEAGVGEATTLANVISAMRKPPVQSLGFDISWSRALCGASYARRLGVHPVLFVGDMAAIPLAEGTVDVVYTSHSIEPNSGREREILSELHRVAGRYLVLLEPSNELGSAETRARMAEHAYCTDLYKHARHLGLNVIEHRLFEYCQNHTNQTALMVIEKSRDKKDLLPTLVCPTCGEQLLLHRGHYYCGKCLLIFPVIDGIPCLLSSNGILGSKYAQDEWRLP